MSIQSFSKPFNSNLVYTYQSKILKISIKSLDYTNPIKRFFYNSNGLN